MNPSPSARPARPARRRRAFLALAALCLLGTFTAAPARAFVLEDYKWPAGDIVMDLQLGTASGLIDGSPSYDSVAESALAIWNPYLGNVQFRVDSTTTPGALNDGRNSVTWAKTVFGSSLGVDTLAVTQTHSRGSTTIESDVTFNPAFKFDSYRGSLRSLPGGGGRLYDIRRVLLHEFGHVLGLDHTAQNAQSIMAPAITDIDMIQADDVTGVVSLYGDGIDQNTAPVITSSATASATAQSAFGYQITATHLPTRFAASGLPAGLSCSSIGWINGTPNVAGTYRVTLSATNPGGTGTAVLTLTVAPLPSITPPIITSATSARVYAGENFSYVISVANGAVVYGASGLPPGVAFNASVPWLLAGVVTTPGTYNIALSASNAGGTGTAVLTLVVYPVWGAHPLFFSSEQPLTDGVYYLSFANRNVFGYYEYLSDPHYIYHFDLGFEYWFDAQDGRSGIYFYDFTSGDWFYTSPTFAFPYLYDFSLQAFLYYYPNPTNPQRYNTDGVRYFYNFATGQVIVR